MPIPMGDAIRHKTTTTYRVVCQRCGETTAERENPYDVIRLALNSGWFVSEDRNKALCPSHNSYATPLERK